MAEAYNSRTPYIEVIGKYVCHTGLEVVLQLSGCGASDSHSFAHRNNIHEYINTMYNGKIVRLFGELSWDYTLQVWGYNWTLHTIGSWEEVAVNSSPEIKRMLGTNR